MPARPGSAASRPKASGFAGILNGWEQGGIAKLEAEVFSKSRRKWDVGSVGDGASAPPPPDQLPAEHPSLRPTTALGAQLQSDSAAASAPPLPLADAPAPPPPPPPLPPPPPEHAHEMTPRPAGTSAAWGTMADGMDFQSLTPVASSVGVEGHVASPLPPLPPPPAQQPKVAAMQAELTALRAEVSACITACVAATTQRDELRDEVTALRTAADVSAKQVEELRAQVKQARKDIVTMQTMAIAQNTKFEQADASLSQLINGHHRTATASTSMATNIAKLQSAVDNVQTFMTSGAAAAEQAEVRALKAKPGDHC
jgi:chorismate mutase